MNAMKKISVFDMCPAPGESVDNDIKEKWIEKAKKIKSREVLAGQFRPLDLAALVLPVQHQDKDQSRDQQDRNDDQHAVEQHASFYGGILFDRS